MACVEEHLHTFGNPDIATHRNVLSHYSLGDLSGLVCHDILFYPTSLGTFLSQITKEYASDHWSIHPY